MSPEIKALYGEDSCSSVEDIIRIIRNTRKKDPSIKKGWQRQFDLFYPLVRV